MVHVKKIFKNIKNEATIIFVCHEPHASLSEIIVSGSTVLMLRESLMM